jgi:hypothetical protein
MRKIVLVHGLSLGAALCLLLLLPFALLDLGTIERRFVLLEKFGYTVMILAMGLVFLGVRRYRDSVLGGAVTFGRALAAGFYMVLTGGLVFAFGTYALHRFVRPGFLEEYLQLQTRRIRESGVSPQEMVSQLEQLAAQKENFLNPAVQATVMLVTVAAIGIPIAVLSAAMLKKK